jgi:hypothetical protein
LSHCTQIMSISKNRRHTTYAYKTAGSCMSYSNHQHVKRRYTAWNEETNPVQYYPHSNVRNPIPYSHGIANAGISGMVNTVKKVNRVGFFIPGGISSLHVLMITVRHARACCLISIPLIPALAIPCEYGIGFRTLLCG